MMNGVLMKDPGWRQGMSLEAFVHAGHAERGAVVSGAFLKF
jgi:hypothetical protein